MNTNSEDFPRTQRREQGRAQTLFHRVKHSEKQGRVQRYRETHEYRNTARGTGYAGEQRLIKRVSAHKKPPEHVCQLERKTNRPLGGSLGDGHCLMIDSQKVASRNLQLNHSLT